MSLQWTLIAAYLYIEIGIVALMILPIFNARRWNQMFKSRILVMFRKNAATYFYVLMGVLTLFLMDSIREMRKYTHHGEGATHTHLATEMKGNVKLFRAQRNFYITGFAIFLAFVIRRLVIMLRIQDELNTKAAELIKEAETTVNLAKLTILSNTLKASEQDYDEIKEKLELTEDLLKVERRKLKDMEEEAEKWKSMYGYEVAKASMVSAGKGDE